MRKILCFLFGVVAPCSAFSSDLTLDTSDPLFMNGRGHVLSETDLSYFETGLRLGQSLSVAFSDRFVFGANVHYQQDFSGSEHGFSSVDLGGIYRIATADENDNEIMYDVLAGLKLGGSTRVRTPDYADSTYYIGMRFGKQYSAVTLAGMIKSNWIFNKDHGVAFIDLTPSIYLRVNDNWRVGADFTLRKATDKQYDEESVGLRVVREYGRTQYVGHFEYAFEDEDVTAGLRVNILF